MSENFQDLNSLEDLASTFLDEETSEPDWGTDENDMTIGKFAPIPCETPTILV